MVAAVQGTGNWYRVRADGYWATDQVANLGLPDDWSAGVKIWDIQIGWNSEPQFPVVEELNPVCG